MKEKFAFIWEHVTDAMGKMKSNEITVDEAKAIAALSKQANNLVVTQLDAAKFLHENGNEGEKRLKQIGL